MPFQRLRTPFTFAAREIDLAHNALANQFSRVSSYNFADEFMTGNPGEPVIPALQLKVCVADPADDQPDDGETLGTFREGNRSRIHFACIKVNGQHF